MRFLLVGLVLFLIPSRLLAQATGFVESIGFDGKYRDDCWTPMVVNLSSQIGEPVAYQIQVVQHDLDQDRQVFTRDIVLNPQDQQKFWVYFIPQPSGIDSGSPDALSRSIQVWLCTAPDSHGATRQLKSLPIHATIENIDQASGGSFISPRGVKLVVCVTDPQENSTPSFDQYRQSLGMMESMEPVEIHAADLPENVIGYESVSAIVWFGASSAELDAAGNKRLDALEEYVRRGGRLIICEPNDVHRLSEFADLLPVNLVDARGQSLIDMRTAGSLAPLISLATDNVARGANGMTVDDRIAAWRSLEKPATLKMAFATPRPDAVADVPIHWPDGGISPYLVRRGYGAGSVTWVAQDLSNPALAGRHAPGWAYIWDAVFGWKSTIHPAEDATDADRDAFGSGEGVSSTDLGAAVLPAMEFPSRGAAYITVAIIFFLVYGLIAGPISYVVLAARKKKELSWFVFALCACAGTALTVGVVRLVLHGDAELHHLSVVRISPGSSAIVRSRIGLYVPHGDMQRVALAGNSPDGVSFITAYPLPPDWFSSSEFPAAEPYNIPVHDAPMDQSVAIDVPIRSTLKKLQARWVGDLPAAIEGTPSLLPAASGGHYIAGMLTNNSGVDLINVYLVFTVPWSNPPQDWMLYLPRWEKGKRIDLDKQFAGAAFLRVMLGMNGAVPGENKAIKAPVTGPIGWSQFFYGQLASHSLLSVQNDRFDDYNDSAPISVPMLSFFDRLGPSKTDKASHQGRVELMRQGGRDFDLSQAVEAGKLAIVARAAPNEQTISPLPEPMSVNGSPIAGEGRVLYQFVLPIDRSKAELPAPTSEPAAAENEEFDHGLHG
jgi:hypothetical protein